MCRFLKALFRNAADDPRILALPPLSPEERAAAAYRLRVRAGLEPWENRHAEILLDNQQGYEDEVRCRRR